MCSFIHRSGSTDLTEWGKSDIVYLRGISEGSSNRSCLQVRDEVCGLL